MIRQFMKTLAALLLIMEISYTFHILTIGPSQWTARIGTDSSDTLGAFLYVGTALLLLGIGLELTAKGGSS